MAPGSEAGSTVEVSKARNMQFSLAMSEAAMVGGSLLLRSAPARVVSRGWRDAAWLRSLAAYLLLPNVLFAILGLFVYVRRPLINVDYLLRACLEGLFPC